MKEKEKLMEFLRLKRQMLAKKYNVQGEDYIEDDVIEKIREWNESSSVWNELKDNIRRICIARLNNSLSQDTCPFCIKHKLHCAICEYGRKYRICLEKSSRFQKFLDVARPANESCFGLNYKEYYTIMRETARRIKDED